MWTRTIFVAVAVSLGVAAFARQAQVVEYQKLKSGAAWYHEVSVDLRSERVQPGVVYSGKLESPVDLTREEQPLVAITGTFFNTWSAYPVGDVVVEGIQEAQGWRGSIIGVDWYGEVEIVDTPFMQPIDLSNYRFALRGAVRLIRNGVVAPDPKGQKFRDPAIWGRATRCGVGTTADGRLVFYSTSQKVTLSELGKAMQASGCTNAVSMDGGSSTCLMVRGEIKIRPARKLSNMFVVYDRSPFLLPGDNR